MNKNRLIITSIVLMVSILCLIPTSKNDSIITNKKAYLSGNKDIGTISYEKKNYTCEKGDVIDTVITANSKSISYVKSYSSSNKEYAVVKKNPDMTLKCYNCVAVRIYCKKAGTVNLKATSSTGAKTKSNLRIKNSTISFGKTTYFCKAGTTFTTLIKSSGTSRVLSYKSNNTKVATIVKNDTLQPNCINCSAVKVTCKKAGKAILTTKSSKGATATASVTVR